MKWIDTTHIRTWAQRRDAQEHLPLLVRKLIRATSNSISSIRFPSGENVTIGGWDGVLEIYEETDYLPLGNSLWEFGTNVDVRGKAEEDYKKRSAEPLGVNTKEATYVFVTPRLWTKKQEWIDEKNAEGIWKEVRAYDAQDLEEWIDLAPTVGAWFAVRHLNIFPQEGIQPADDFWEEWSTGTKINFLPDVVLAGRSIQAQELTAKTFSPSLITVQGNSTEEALAFTVATFIIDENKSEDFLSRSLIVDRVEAFRELMIIDKPLFLICRFEDDSVLNRAVAKGHTVIVPIGLDHTGTWSSKIVLPPLHREAFVQALQKSGLSEQQAEDISKKTARNLIVIRRQLEFKRLMPIWSLSDKVNDILPAILAGRWNEDNAGDREIVAKLAGEDYDQYIKRLQSWCFTGDAPIVKIGNTWRLTSPMDAWTHASKYFTKEDFSKLADISFEILSAIDKKFDLPAENRHQASWYGIKSAHSVWLREGVIQSLTLISVYGDQLGLDIAGQPENWVDQAINKLLDSSDLNLWRSLDHFMPKIAEASPASFIASVEKLIAIENSPIIGLLQEDPGLLHSQSYHTGMLWALENIAWMPSYLTRAVLILAGMAEKDPGGQLSNRPMNSLSEIFKSWHPQTFAPVEARLDVLARLQEVNPGIAFTLLLRLLPNHHGIAQPTHKMLWRLNDHEHRTGITYDDLYKTHSGIIELLMSKFDKSQNQFEVLLEKSVAIDYFDREKLLTFLGEKFPEINFEGTKTWDAIRKILGHHRSHPKAQWSLPEDILQVYEDFYNKLEPEDEIKKKWWLFTDNWPDLPEGRVREISSSEHATLLQEKRNAVLLDIYRECGFAKILELAEIVSDQLAHIYGFTLGNVLDDQDEIEKLAEFLKTDDKHLRIVQSFIQRKVFANSVDWLFDFYGRLKANGFDPLTLVKMFVNIRADRAIWDFIAQTEQAIIENYWKKVDPNVFMLNAEDKGFALDKLIEYKRYATAIYEISHSIDDVSPEKMIEVLNGFITTEAEIDVRVDSYNVESIFEAIDKSGKADHTEMIKLEWLYMPLLGSGYGDTKTPRLCREMAENPEFFIEVLSIAFKGSGDENIDNKDEIQENSNDQKVKYRMAEQAFNLLYHWTDVPGVDSQGEINEDKLKDWVTRARAHAEELHRKGITDDQIGKVFASFPEPNTKMEPGKDIGWPPEAICNVLENIGTPEMLSGFSTGCYNKRGFSSRSPFEGGTRERHLNKYFMALAAEKATKFPRIASIFEQLAKGYNQEAKREDESALRDSLDY